MGPGVIKLRGGGISSCYSVGLELGQRSLDCDVMGPCRASPDWRWNSFLGMLDCRSPLSHMMRRKESSQSSCLSQEAKTCYRMC